ncbi:hypothetical protein HWI79_3422 [Cryptosporidium felis]|nr:hypothetical protein HWI79_3422 [Cryptosporidium felis]
MQNWEILENSNIKERSDKNEKTLFLDLLGESDQNISFNEMNFDKKFEEIISLIDESNKDKTELVTSFPSCPLAIIKNYSKDNELEGSMEIDRMSLSSSEIHSSNDSPIFDPRSSQERRQGTESPESMNITDLL